MLQLSTPQPSRHPSPTAKATRLAHLIWERPDMERAEAFLTSFGLLVAHRTSDSLYLRGTAAAPFCYVVRKAAKPRFVGFALEVGARADLERIAATVPGASGIAQLGAPGGGEVVRLTDPAGFVVEVVHGQQPFPALPHRAPLENFNTVAGPARVNATQRVPLEAPQVVKLGHLALELAGFQETCGWYTRHFGFIPSDTQVLSDGSPAVTFMRLDLGSVPADHHTLALVQGVVATYSHSAYEVVDADAVGMGQRVLRERGYRHSWGLGRHILGSQIFDYWQDPWGDKHEHYSDGDVFTADVPMGVHAVGKDAMAQWGPPLPGEFVRPRLGLGLLVAVVRNLRSSPDLTLRKLREMARLFA